MIIGVTGHALTEDVNEFLAAGADLVLLKPLQPHQLNALLMYIHNNGFESTEKYSLVWKDDRLIRKEKR